MKLRYHSVIINQELLDWLRIDFMVVVKSWMRIKIKMTNGIKSVYGTSVYEVLYNY